MLGCDPLGPGPYDPDAPSPQSSGLLVVEPTRLDFGAFDCLEDAPRTGTLLVTNRGGGELVVAGLNLIVGSDAFSADAPALLRLEPGDSYAVDVQFAPISDGIHEAQLVPNGAVRVELLGQAMAPRARLLDEALDLGATRVGCASEGDTLLLNDGSLPLRIDGAALAGSSAFGLIDPLPAVLEPGEDFPIRLRFTPLDGGSQEASLSFATNDPAAPTTALRVGGLGVPGGRVVESFDFAPVVQADLLFVVDASAALNDALTAAREDSARLFAALDAGDVDWHVAVTNPATDCNSTDAPFLDAGMFSRYTAEQAGEALAEGLNLAPGSFEPTLLQQAAAVLERTGELECLDGFLRADAQLHVVLLAGRPDSSPNTPETYVERMRARVASDSHLVVSAIAGDGETCADGGAIHDAAAMTGGLVLDPCAMAWSAIYEAIAMTAISSGDGQATYTLAETPVPDTLVVRHGTTTLQAWRYDADTNSVVIDGEQEGLVPGDPIEIEYLEAIACEG